MSTIEQAAHEQVRARVPPRHPHAPSPASSTSAHGSCCPHRPRQVTAKTGRKLAAQAKRKMGLAERQREAERRKAEVMKTCTSGGMKHTAAAMMNRA